MTTEHPPIWHGLTPEEHEYQYNPQAAVPDFAANRARREPWNARAAAALRVLRDIPYAEGALCSLDIYPAASVGAPVHLFFHGGYWRAQDKANFAFLAEPLVRHGVTAVIANYPLCPAAALDQVVTAARDAVAWVAQRIAEYGGDPGRITLSGHSAGAHLTAAVLAEDWPARGMPADLVKAAVMISGIYDPTPAMGTSVNSDIRLTSVLATRHNYERIPPRALGCRTWILAGGHEPWQWIDQSFRYAHHLHRHGIEPGVLVCPGFHHFDILDQYADDTSLLMQLLLHEAKGSR